MYRVKFVVFSYPKSIRASKEVLQPRLFLFKEGMWRWHGIRCLVGHSRTFNSQEIPNESCKSEMCRNGADALWDHACAEHTGIMFILREGFFARFIASMVKYEDLSVIPLGAMSSSSFT